MFPEVILKKFGLKHCLECKFYLKKKLIRQEMESECFRTKIVPEAVLFEKYFLLFKQPLTFLQWRLQFAKNNML